MESDGGGEMSDLVRREAAVAIVTREHDYDDEIEIPTLLRRLEMYLGTIPAAPVDELLKAFQHIGLLPLARPLYGGDYAASLEVDGVSDGKLYGVACPYCGIGGNLLRIQDTRPGVDGGWDFECAKCLQTFKPTDKGVMFFPLSIATKYDALVKAAMELYAGIQGCGDHSCLIEPPKGMGTNGGCQCVRDYVKMQRVLQRANRVRAALAALEGDSK